MVKYVTPKELTRSPYWISENVEKSRTIIESLINDADVSPVKKDIFFKNFLDSRIKIKGIKTIGELEICKEKEPKAKVEEDASKPGAKPKATSKAKATVKPKAKVGAKTKEDNDRKLKKTFRCRSYRMHVDKINSSKLRLFNDDARYVYNAVVAYLKGKSKKIDGFEKIRIRNLFTISKNNTEQTDVFNNNFYCYL